MQAVREWRGRHTTAGALAIVAVLGIMLDTVWTGKTGEGCKSSISTEHLGR